MNLDFLLDGSSIREYWNKKTKIFSGQEKLSNLLPASNELIDYCTGSFVNGIWSEPLGVNINASLTTADMSHRQLLSVDIKTARNCYINGFSLCFGDMSADISKISELKAKAVEIFDFPDLISVTGYLSPPKAIGVLHFDRQHNFFIQREGVKKWFVSEKPAVRNPHDNLVYTGLTQSFFEDMRDRGYDIRVPRDCGKLSYQLNPGDILYVPPGFYHSPETLDNSSLHYTLTIEPACFWKEFNKEMFAALLSSNGKYFEDFRFFSKAEKTALFKDCFDTVSQPQDVKLHPDMTQ